MARLGGMAARLTLFRPRTRLEPLTEGRGRPRPERGGTVGRGGSSRAPRRGPPLLSRFGEGGLMGRLVLLSCLVGFPFAFPAATATARPAGFSFNFSGPG